MIRNLTGVSLWSLLIVSSLSWMSFFSLPYELESLVSRFSVSEEAAGWIASSELLSLALAAVFFGRTVAKKDKRLLSIYGVSLAIIGTAVSIVADHIELLVVARIVLGFGLGILTASTNAIPANYSDPEKIYAKMLATMAIVYGGLLFVIPHSNALLGAKGFDVVQLVVVCILGAFSFLLPTANSTQPAFGNAERAKNLSRYPVGVIALLVAILALYASQSVGWTFAVSAAHSIDLSESQIGNTFTINALLQIPFALYVTWLGMRFGYFKPIAIGLISLIFCMLCQYLIPNQWLFMICGAFASAGSCIAYPYMLGALAELDPSGSSSAIAGAVLYFGAAVGPALAGYSYSLAGLPGVGYLSAFLLVVSLFVSYIAVVAVARRKRVAAAA